MKGVILASGNLGFKCLKICVELFIPEFIATDSNSKDIIQFAKEQGIDLFIGNPRKGKLSSFINDATYDFLLSINYLFLIELDVISRFKYPINFHGSLLPKYRGRTPHVWAIINNETKTGITAHIIDQDCDTGDIVLQREVDIKANETGMNILKKFEMIYPEMIEHVYKKLNNNNLKSKRQNHIHATYFGKRTPEDGKVNWNWQKERIFNWIRAQSEPYPGAFTMLNEFKIIIDKVKFSDLGFLYDLPNGLVLSTNPNIVVKTPNGAVEVVKSRSDLTKIKQGDILS